MDLRRLPEASAWDAFDAFDPGPVEQLLDPAPVVRYTALEPHLRLEKAPLERWVGHLGVEGLGFRVQGLWLRVEGLGLRVEYEWVKD